MRSANGSASSSRKILPQRSVSSRTAWAADGTVPMAFAELPGMKTFYVEESHGSLPNNGAVGRAVKTFRHRHDRCAAAAMDLAARRGHPLAHRPGARQAGARRGLRPRVQRDEGTAPRRSARRHRVAHPWETLNLNGWQPALDCGLSRRYLAENLSIAKWLEERRHDTTLNILLVVNPTGDLNGAVKEGARVRELFAAHPDEDH